MGREHCDICASGKYCWVHDDSEEAEKAETEDVDEKKDDDE